MLNSEEEFINDKTENDNIVYNRKQYRRESIIRWREKRGKYPMVRPVFLAKKLYRRDAIIRWKLKRKKHPDESTSAILVHYNAQKSLSISGETSNLLSSDVLMEKKQYRRAAIERWKKKTTKNRILLASSCLANEKALQNSFALGETWSYMRRQLNNRTGKHLLQQVPFASDVLPDTRRCRYCDAVKFYSETYNFCCLNGRVVLSSNELPLLMQHLLTSTSEEALLFRTYIRTYNNHFAFTSFGVRSDSNLSKRDKGIYTFRVQGQVYHFINNLAPRENDSKNLQLYFHDTDNELENRLSDSPRLCINLIAKCVEYLKDNPYARFFRNLRDVPNLDEYKIILKTIPGQDQRVFNKPEVSQVAALWIAGQENGENGRRNIEVKLHRWPKKYEAKIHRCYGQW